MIIIQIVIGLVALKACIVGSEFSFYYWFRYGNKYIEWYFNREEYIP